MAKTKQNIPLKKDDKALLWAKTPAELSKEADLLRVELATARVRKAADKLPNHSQVKHLADTIAVYESIKRAKQLQQK